MFEEYVDLFRTLPTLNSPVAKALEKEWRNFVRNSRDQDKDMEAFIDLSERATALVKVERVAAEVVDELTRDNHRVPNPQTESEAAEPAPLAQANPSASAIVPTHVPEQPPQQTQAPDVDAGLVMDGANLELPDGMGDLELPDVAANNELLDQMEDEADERELDAPILHHTGDETEQWKAKVQEMTGQDYDKSEWKGAFPELYDLRYARTHYFHRPTHTGKGQWHIYRQGKHHWEKIATDCVRKETTDRLKLEVTELIEAGDTRKEFVKSLQECRSSTITEWQTIFGRPERQRVIDENRNLLAFTNCVFDRQTWLPRPGHHTDNLTRSFPYDYRPWDEIQNEPTARRLEVILEQIFGSEKLRFICVILASSLFLDVGCIFILKSKHRGTGNGKNGKSAALQLFKSMFAGFAARLDSKEMLKDPQKTLHNATLCNAIGSLFMYLDELEAGIKWSSKAVQTYAEGNDIAGRGAYDRKMTAGDIKGALMVATNFLPMITTTEEGVWRRIVYIELESIFMREADFVPNPNEHKYRMDTSVIRDAKNGIFRTYMMSYVLHHTRDFLSRDNPDWLHEMPLTIRESTAKFRVLSNPYADFIDKHFENRGNQNYGFYWGDVTHVFLGQYLPNSEFGASAITKFDQHAFRAAVLDKEINVNYNNNRKFQLPQKCRRYDERRQQGGYGLSLKPTSYAFALEKIDEKSKKKK